jgi:hypothetical protein
MSESEIDYDQKSTPLFSIHESWEMSEPSKVIAIIRDVGCWRLGHWDGCCCSHFSVRDVTIEISCGKGREQGVWVYSAHSFYAGRTDDFDLQGIADVVLDELRRGSGQRDNWTVYLGEPAE